MLSGPWKILSSLAIVLIAQCPLLVAQDNADFQELQSTAPASAAGWLESLQTSPEYRAIVEQNWKVMKLELKLQYTLKQFEKVHNRTDVLTDGNSLLPVGARRELANIRNLRLKHSREKSKLNAMRDDLIRHVIESVEN